MILLRNFILEFFLKFTHVPFYLLFFFDLFGLVLDNFVENGGKLFVENLSDSGLDLGFDIGKNTFLHIFKLSCVLLVKFLKGLISLDKARVNGEVVRGLFVDEELDLGEV